MSNWVRDDVTLSHLEINTENPRFELTEGQSDAIVTTLADQGQKIFNLARDIAKHGLNPAELTIVSPQQSKKDRYTVLEGNRRIIALKLLRSPSLATPSHQALLSQFQQLSKEYKDREIKKVPCVIFADPEAAFRWIKLKHTGENDGVGVVRWDAHQVARFDSRTGDTSAIAIQAIDFLKNSSLAPRELKQELKSLPLTNLDRLLTDNNIQNVLGIRIQDGNLVSTLQEREVVKGLIKIVSDLITKKIKVKDIYAKGDRAKYIETFKREEIPQKDTIVAEPWALAANLPSPHSSIRRKSSPLSIERKQIIPRDCILQILDKRINSVYSELKNLNCDDFPNSAAVMMRVFLELSGDSYITTHKLKSVTLDSKLHQKLEQIAKDLERRAKLTTAQLKGVRTAVSNPNHILSTNTFNAYIHNRHFSPIANDLKITWDNIQLFFEAIWGA
jgi:hypothetical protein